MQNAKTHNAIIAAGTRRGFTLLEVMTALVILAFVSSSVLVLINRSITSAADSAFRMEAFKLARENMEKLLSANIVTETVEYGISEQHPGISWRTVVETFAEPVTGQMWVRAVCSADYTDSLGETQTVELVNWLSQLTEQQASQLAQEGSQDLDALAAEQLVEYVEDAALYAGVEAATIEQWLDTGLVTTSEGAFIKYNLDIFVRREGNPTDEEKAQQVSTIEELANVLKEGTPGAGDGTTDPALEPDGADPTAGMPTEERDGVLGGSTR
ncbi:MAG: prepilin-type N-terminal cleavage/methylation domain-containing protein [Sedimentisphaerales bacterium]|nr:prepilin-type N-terminal cleavage/methylation domain-containing protein [Sedimentisphaerales bacterium]